MAVATAEATTAIEAAGTTAIEAAAEDVKVSQESIPSGAEQQSEVPKPSEKQLAKIVKDVGADLASFGSDLISAWSLPAPVVQGDENRQGVKEKKVTEIAKDVGHDLALLAKDVYDAWHEASPVSTIYNSLMTPFRGRLVLAGEKPADGLETGKDGKTESAAPVLSGGVDASKPKVAEVTGVAAAGTGKDDEFEL